MTPQFVGEGLDGNRWFSTDGTALVYTDVMTAPDQVTLRHYDLGADGLHQEETGAADAGEGERLPFPLTVTATVPPMRMELDGARFAVEVRENATRRVVYGQLDVDTVEWIPGEARLAGIEDGYLAYVTGDRAPWFHALDLNTLEVHSAPLPRYAGTTGKPWGEMGKIGDWFLFGTRRKMGARNILLLVNPFTGMWYTTANNFTDYISAVGMGAPDMEDETVVFNLDMDGIPQLFTLSFPEL
jgi:hypothetical protein